MCLRQAYKRKEIAKVKWIKGNLNLTNAITKSNTKSLNALKRLIDTNTLQLEVEEWVKRG
jgi:hypothetical protein